VPKAAPASKAAAAMLKKRRWVVMIDLEEGDASVR
jgi:hypothetical protein